LRIRGKITLALAILALCAALVSFLRYLASESFFARVRSEVISRIEQATGLTCTIAGLKLSVWQGSFDMLGFSLQARPGSSPLRLDVEEVRGTLKLLSIVRLNPSISDLTLVRPHLRLEAGTGGGGVDPEELLRAFRTSLDMAVGAINVQDGLIEVGGRRFPLNLSLTDFACEIRHRPEVPSYQVHLAYRNGRVSWDEQEVLYDLDARGMVSMKGLDIDSVEFRTGKSRLSGDGWMRDWKSPTFLFHVAGSVNCPELAIFERHLRDSSGEIKVLANLKLDAEGFHLTGRYSTSDGRYMGAAVGLRDGFVEIKDGTLWLRDVEGRLGPGSFRANASFSLLRRVPAPHRFEIEVKRAALRDAARILELPQIDYDNTVDGTVGLKWRAGARDLEVHSRLRLAGEAETGPGTGRSLALRGALAFDYSGGRWYFPSVDLRSQNTEITAAEKGASRYRLRLRTSSLAEPLRIMSGFSESVDSLLRSNPDLLDISGSYELDGEIGTDASGRFAYDGTLGVKGGRWRSYALDSLAGRAAWDGRELQLRSIEAHRGAAAVHGNVDLTVPAKSGEKVQWSFRGSWSGVTIDALKDFGLEPGIDLTGTVSGSGALGSLEGGWRGDGQLLIDKGSYAGEAFDLVRARLRFDGQDLQIIDCEMTRGSARLDLEGQIRPETGDVDLRVRLAAFSLRSLPAVKENKVDVDGRISGSGELRGTFKNPVLGARLELDGLRYADWELGRGKGTIEMKDRRLQGDLSVQSELGSARFRANLSTEPGYPGTATLELTDWNARKLIADKMPSVLSELSTALQGTVSIRGSFAAPASLEYDGEIDGARLKIHEYELRNSGKIHFTISSGKLAVKDTRIVGEGTNLVLNGEVPTDGSESMNVRLDGQLDLKLLEHLEKKAQVEGSAAVNVRATGSLRAPQIVGQAVLDNARLAWGEIPFRLSAVRGKLIFSRNLLRIENLRGSVASGTIQVSGAIEHQDTQLRGINLQVSARQTSFPYPRDFHSTVDADLNLRGGPDAQVLSGEIRVTRAEYTRNLNLLEQVAARSSAAPATQTIDPLLAGLRFNVSISSSEGLSIDNELTRLRGGMKLTLRGTPAFPSLLGRIEATSGAIFFRGNRFDIIRASADFLDRNRINPVLEVRAEADVQSYRMVLDVSGDLDHLRFNVTSDPPLSTVDILTLLTTGKSVEPGTESSRRQTEITGLSAASILSENLTGVIGKRVQRIFGLQTFRVDPFLAGAENDPTARVTISERLSRDLSITFSRNLSTNEEQIVIVEYQVSRNMSVVATRDENGKFGLDFRFRKRFR